MAESEEEKQAEEIKKKAEVKKKAKEAKRLKIPQKKLYTVKLEAQAPVELIYRVWAENPEQAVELLRYGTLTAPPKPKLSRKKNIKATVYRYGTVMIEFVKRYT
jgi:hypothetical protein